MQRRKGIFSAGTETKTQAVKSGDTDTQLPGLAMGNVSDGTMKLRGWLAKQSQGGRSRAVMLDSIKAKLAERIRNNL